MRMWVERQGLLGRAKPLRPLLPAWNATAVAPVSESPEKARQFWRSVRQSSLPKPQTARTQLILLRAAPGSPPEQSKARQSLLRKRSRLLSSQRNFATAIIV